MTRSVIPSDAIGVVEGSLEKSSGGAVMYFYKQNNQIVSSVTPLTKGEELIPNTVDASQEKHVPVIEQHGDHVTVKVGSVEHPMLPAHYIQWIILETQTGYQKKDLTPNDKPEADFAVTEPILAAYEYCNLHGLWKAET